jgi:3-oxoacyl-[acyl-carrier protein] reductase
MSSVIVTGAAAGNGLAIAKKLRQHGHVVIGVDLAPIPPNACDLQLQGDVLDPFVIDQAFTEVIKSGPSVYLVNNAGITAPGFPQTDRVWQQTIDINLSAPFRWSRRFSELVVSREITEGGIVFIGSLATTMGGISSFEVGRSRSHTLLRIRSWTIRNSLQLRFARIHRHCNDQDLLQHA